MVRQGAGGSSVILAPLGCEGWGPERQALPCTLVSPSGTQAEARDREAAVEWVSRCYSSRPFPHRCGQRRPRRCGDGGGGRRALGTGLSFPSAPGVWVGEWEDSDSENGNLNRGFHLTTHLLFLF